jgi:hypothetical protein
LNWDNLGANGVSSKRMISIDKIDVFPKDVR